MNNRKGFSLIEAIIAAVILSFAVMALSGICTRSLTSVRTNRDYEQAWEVLDRQLETITYIKSQQSEETPPSKEYLAVIQQGYRDWRIF